MFRISLIIPVISVFLHSSEHLTISDEDYKLLPPIYGMDDFKQCVGKKNSYCTADIKLDSFYKNSSTWKLIEETRREKFAYNHDTIHRAICVPKMYENKQTETENFAAVFVSKEIEKLNLSHTIVNMTCNRQSNFTATDTILLCLIFSYFTLICSATLYDKNGIKTGSAKGSHILIAFSLRSNFKKIFDHSKNRDYEKLKCVQGLRTLSSIFTIWFHTKASYMFTFVEDTKYIEDMYEFHYTYILFDYFIIQVFLLISAWLLTIKVFDIFEANKKFTLNDVILLFINRCFRFWPVLLFAMSIQRRVFLQKLMHIPLPHFLDASDSACQNYWWASLLFMQNFLKVKDMCFGPAWYLSNDIQLYVISLAILYSILKFKYVNYFLGFYLFMSCAWFGFIIYLNDLDVVFRSTPEGFKWRNFYHDSTFAYLYTMTHVNSITYILGICFGIFYCRLRHNQDFTKKIFFPIWNLSFIGLPMLAIAIASREFKGLSAALVAPLLKLIFSLGIGMGILGMSQSTDTSIFKKALEWRPLEFLSQFTFCSFMYHTFVVFIRSFMMQEPLDVSNSILIKSAVQDAICGFLIAFVTHLLVELPWSNIQKTYLPQVKKRTIKSK